MDRDMMPMVMQRRKKRPRCLIALWVCLGLAAGLWAATQFFAWRMQHQPALGPQWEHVYYPWRILQWAWLWGRQYPTLFIQAGSAGVVTSSILLFFVALAKGFSSSYAKPNEVLHGSARWASKEDIKKAGLLGTEGVYVGGWKDQKTGKEHYLRHNGSQHLLCFAPTRSGKGLCLVIPTLLTWMESCVITDLKGELWALTAGWRKMHADNIVLRFEPATESGSISWNPMDEIRVGTAYEIGDAQNLATMLVDPDGKGLKDHWQKTAQALLVGCILHLLYKRLNGDVQIASLPAVDAMLADPAKPVQRLWEDMITYEHQNGRNHPVVAQSAQDMIDRPVEEAGSVLSTAKSYLALYRDPVVARNVADSGFRINDLMYLEKPVSLYIITQPVDKVRLKPLVRIMINMICRTLAEKLVFEETPLKTLSIWRKAFRFIRGKSTTEGGGRRAKGTYKHKLLMMLDEFPGLGKLEIIQESLAFLAGFGFRFYLICQDIAQLRNDETGYGPNEAISANSHIQNAFQPNKLDTAQHLSKLTGQTTVIKEQITVSGRRIGVLGNVSRTIQEVSRPLMTEDECMRMPPPIMDGDTMLEGGDMLVYVAGFPAIYGKQMPYFLDPVFQARSSVNPPDCSDRIIDVPPQVTLG